MRFVLGVVPSQRHPGSVGLEGDDTVASSSQLPSEGPSLGAGQVVGESGGVARAVLRPVLSALLALAALAAAAPAAQAADGVPRSGHVFLIVGENTSLSQITPAHAPYLTQTLRPRAAWLTHYSSFPKSSSLGQYIALTSGQFTKCEANNDLPSARCHQRIDNVFQQLDRTGRGWFDWEESMTNACDIFDSGSAWSKNIYSAHHNPAPLLHRRRGRPL